MEGASKDTSKPKRLGKKGEELACLYLSNNGVQILERNWNCTAGEADIIIREGEDLAFIEVKTRSSLNGGFPEDSVTRQKRAKYEKIASQYLASHPQPNSRIRFDVIAIMILGKKQAFLRHHRDAFSVGEEWRI